MSYNFVAFSELKGKVLVDVKVDDDSSITLITSTGEAFVMYHEEDCCESVTIESVVGD